MWAVESCDYDSHIIWCVCESRELAEVCASRFHESVEGITEHTLVESADEIILTEYFTVWLGFDGNESRREKREWSAFDVPTELEGQMWTNPFPDTPQSSGEFQYWGSGTSLLGFDEALRIARLNWEHITEQTRMT